jgi:hypothetical protein
MPLVTLDLGGQGDGVAIVKSAGNVGDFAGDLDFGVTVQGQLRYFQSLLYGVAVFEDQFKTFAGNLNDSYIDSHGIYYS